MTWHCLAEGGLTQTQQAVRDQFQRGGSILTAAAVVGVCLGIVGLVYWLTRRQAARLNTSDDPHGLFRFGLDRLPLTDDQRVLLSAVSRSERLEHPATLLLSRTLYDRHVDAWLDIRNQPRIDERLRTRIQTAGQLRALLFPNRA